MPTSLTYFDFDGSRGLECRLALGAAGLPYEDIRLDRAQFQAIKPTVPFGALPLLTIDGKRLAQSNAILGYIGRGHGLHPADPWIAAEHEAILQSVEDLRQKLPDGKGQTEDEKKAAREAFAAGWMAQWCATISDRIAGPFLEGAKLHVADLKVYVILHAYLSGTFDHIPAATLNKYPKLLALHAAVDGHPAVQAYFNSRKR